MNSPEPAAEPATVERRVDNPAVGTQEPEGEEYANVMDSRSNMPPSRRSWNFRAHCYEDVYEYRYYEDHIEDEWGRCFPYPRTGAHSRGDGRENYRRDNASEYIQAEADRLERGHRLGWHRVGPQTRLPEAFTGQRHAHEPRGRDGGRRHRPHR